MMTPRVIVIDTSGFFASAQSLRAVVTELEVGQASLVTLDLVVFEFLKVLEQEVNRAKGRGNSRRTKVLQSLSERFPVLLHEFDIDIKTGGDFTLGDVNAARTLISRGHESGDSMVWIKMQKLALATILTDDLHHWKSLGADVLPISASGTSFEQ